MSRFGLSALEHPPASSINETYSIHHLYMNTLARQLKSLGFIKSQGGTPSLRILHPCYREPPQRDERTAGCQALT